jgi:hypothetical protein
MERPDSSEDLAALPRLARADLPREVESIRRESVKVGGVEAIVHPLFTNGIVYLDMAFPLDSLPRKSLTWLPLASRFLTGAGLVGESYDRVALRLARSAGGFSAILDSGSPASLPGAAPRSYAVFRLKALAERFSPALELVMSLLTGADYGDEKRISDICSELRNDVLSAVVPAGNAFAQTRAASYFGEASAIEELWRGTSQVEFLLSLKDAKAAAMAASLRSLSASIFARKGLRLNLSAEEGAVPGALAAVESALASLSDEARSGEGELGMDAPNARFFAPAAGCEAYAISAQVGFAAAAAAASKLGDPCFGHETLLAHFLSTGPLWEELRVKRGAYGASVWTDGLEGIACFSSYRDPRPVDALSFFGEALDQAEARFSPGGGGTEAEVEEAAIGAIGRELRPMLPEERGFVDFRRSLYGITDSLRQAKRDAMLAASSPELAAAAGRLAASYRGASVVLISRAEDVQSMLRGRPDTLVRELPL